jgi:hypothetical protein
LVKAVYRSVRSEATIGLLHLSPVAVCWARAISQASREATMSTEPADRQQLKINEFMRLLPLTTAIAGLPDATLGHLFTEGQMEVRVSSLKQAYKLARQLLIDISTK